MHLGALTFLCFFLFKNERTIIHIDSIPRAMNTLLRRSTSMVLLFVLFFLSSCGAVQEKKVVLTPATMWTQESIPLYLAEPTPQSIAGSGVFSFGEFTGFDEKTRAYTTARKEKVTEMVRFLDQFSLDATRMSQILPSIRAAALRSEFLALLVYPEESSAILSLSKEQMLQSLMTERQGLLYREVHEARIAATSEEARAGLLQTEYVLASIFADMTTSEIEHTYKAAKTLLVAASVEGNALKKTLAQEIERNMGEIPKDSGAVLLSMHRSLGLLAYGEKVLITADYAFAQEVLESLPAQIAQVKEALAKGTRSVYASPQVMEFVPLLTKEMEERMQVLSYYVKEYDASRLLSTPVHLSENTMVPYAHAGVRDSLSWLGGKLSDATGVVVDVAKSGAVLTWDATKDLAIAGKDLAVATAKTGGKIIGAGLDVVDASVKSTFDTAVNVAYLEKPSTILTQIKENYVASYERIKDGHGGAAIFSQAKAYMEGSEEAAQHMAEKVVSLTPLGKGITSTTIGYIAKTTTGFFTGTAKDMYDVLNPDSSEEDTLMGMLGLGLTAIGGSSTAAKPTEVIKDGVVTTKQLFTKGVQTFTSVGTSTSIKNIFKGDVKETLVSIFSKKALSSSAEVVEETLVKGLKNSKGYLDEGFLALKGKLSKDIPEKFAGLWEKKSFGAILDDVFGTTGDTPTQWIKGYLETIVSSSADDLLKNTIKKGTTSLFVGDEKVQTALIGSALEELVKKNPEFTQSMTLPQKEAIEKVFGPILPDSKERIPAFEGTYAPRFSIQLTVSGMNTSGSGTVEIQVAKIGVTCHLTATQTVSGAIQGMRINASSRAQSSSCGGNIDQYGHISLTGSATGFGTTTVMGQSAQSAATSPFTVTGTIVNKKFQGELLVRGYTMKLE